MKNIYGIMSRGRMWKKYKIHAKQSKAENFLKKYKIIAIKFIILLLICTLENNWHDNCLSPNFFRQFFLLERAKRCIRDSPHLGQGVEAWTLCPPPRIRYWILGRFADQNCVAKFHMLEIWWKGLILREQSWINLIF